MPSDSTSAGRLAQKHTQCRVNAHQVPVKTDTDCHLTLINVDGSGKGTVIFPNAFQKKNFIQAGHHFQFPGADAPFQFRLKDHGVEKVIALCNAKGGKVDTIAHDFNTRKFTQLGDYEKFVTRAIVVEAAKKETKKEPQKVAKRAGVARSAIKIVVK